VRKLTSDPATVFGIKDRGRLKTGCAADLLLFDPQSVNRGAKKRVQDLPAGGTRLITPAIGVHGVWVNGVRIADSHGAMPQSRLSGRVLRDFLS
jgi:N-acyl-D-aspartate/D-glutamate deacylase